MHGILRRLVLALTLAGLVSAASATAATAGELAVTPGAGLAASQEVTAVGTGYSAATYPIGVYVAQVAVVDGTVHASSASASWIQSVASGGFTDPVPVTRTFESIADGSSIDCLVHACLVAAWRAHTNPTVATLDGQQAISFTPPAAQLEVTPATGLTAPDAEVAVEGAEFYPSVYPNGVYAAQVAVVDGVVRYLTANAKWLRTNPSPTPGQGRLEADGTFSTTMTALKSFTSTNGAVEVDCAVVRCEIASWRGHTVPASEASLLAREPIEFEGGGPGPGPDPGPGPGPGAGGGLSLLVSPYAGLSTTGPSTVAVQGSGYSATEPGIYVVFGPQAGNQDPGAYYDAKWLHPSDGTLSSAGTFATALAVAPTYTNGSGQVVNCTVVQCYVQTLRAHGQTDVDQTAAFPVFFGAVVPTPEPEAAPPAQPGADVVATGASAAASSAERGRPPALSSVKVRRNGRASLRVSEPSTVTFTVRRRVKGRWKTVRTVTVEAKAAGTVSARLKLRRAGRYRISIAAVGRSGATSATHVRTVKVARKGRKGAARAAPSLG